MKVGDLVRHIMGDVGIVVRIDHDHYCSRKTLSQRENNFELNYEESANRILVLFSTDEDVVQSYCPQGTLEVIRDGRC